MLKMKKGRKKKKLEIHCPVSGCLFAEGSERYFTEKRFFDQHYGKVHAEKKYLCSKCQKGFGLDWWRKQHEKTCGVIWKCDCGTQYPSRESLLTHFRRTDHKPSSDSSLNAQKNQNKKNQRNSKPSEKPVVVLIQPIIQNISFIQPPCFTTNNMTHRRILPKTTLPLHKSLPLPTKTLTPALVHPKSSSTIIEQTGDSSLDSSPSLVNTETPKHSQVLEGIRPGPRTGTNTNKSRQRTISTQTIDETPHSANHRQSQASQCSRRKPKSLKVGIESHTQTAESAVVKIKKRKTRRKSVAIVTETSMLTDPILGPDNVYWPGFRDFVLQHAESLGARLFKSSTSTQTSSMNCNKTVCDSETLTDNDLVKSAWDKSFHLNYDSKSKDQFGIIPNDQSDSITLNIESPNLQGFSIFNDEKLNIYSKTAPQNPGNTNAGFRDNLSSMDLIMSGNNRNDSEASKNARINSEHGTCADSSIVSLDQNYSVFNTFETLNKSSIQNKISDGPALTDIYTQTTKSEILDYNLLTNMETQTTDDFNFSYLEFSDTETQTPWEDFLNTDDVALNTDQLSIEIQTDFSSFDPGLNLDPCEFINSFDQQNRALGGPSKESAGVSTETQTLDQFYLPQFTNTESQTLDLVNSFMF